MANHGIDGYSGYDLDEYCDADDRGYDHYFDYEKIVSPRDAAVAIVHHILQENDVVIFAFTYCGPCKKTKALLDRNRVPYLVYNLDTDPNITKEQYFDALEPLSGIRTVPQVFIRGKFYGGSQEVQNGLFGGQVQKLVGAYCSDAEAIVSRLLQENDVVLFAYTYCGPCQKTKALLNQKGIPYVVYNLDTDPNITRGEYADALERLSGIRTVPQLFIHGKFYGDSELIRAGIQQGEVQQMCEQSEEASATVDQLLRDNDMIMFANSVCGYSRKTKRQLEVNEIPYTVHYVDTDLSIDKKHYQDALENLSGIRTLPQVFIRGKFYGDSQQTQQGLETGEIQYLCNL